MEPQPVGISGFAAYFPPYRVCLREWSEWTGNDWEKISTVVGRSFRMRGPGQSVYTMAATAVLRLIRNYEVDPSRVRFLGFGTESSTDNSAGAIIIKGMVDQALIELGLPPLARECEVPEFKHACLGGVYAMKNALRYLALDGAEAQAIVVSADLAEYARGSTGEQTQGAGAVAMLMEQDPQLATVDLTMTGSASDYRAVDFRKPFVRFSGQTAGENGQLQDFPLFNGKYSTTCYLEATIQALSDMFRKRPLDPAAYFRRLDHVFMHRPYRRMPETGFALGYLFALSHGSGDDHAELGAYCRAADETLQEVLAEMHASPDLTRLRDRETDLDLDVYPRSMNVLRAFRSTPGYKEIVLDKMALGTDEMARLGNLYTAALPAWLAAGFEDAAERGLDLAGQEVLTVGYGSGDAAEVIPMTVVPGWQQAAQRIGLTAALAGDVQLDRAQYEALHDGASCSVPHTPSDEFVVTRIGESGRDDGVEYYAYRP
jgi:hydroxymethylglutaryl-CoA synthase